MRVESVAIYTYPNAKASSSSIKCSSSVNINRYFSRDFWRHPAPQRSCQDRTQFVLVTWHLTVLVQFTVNTLACPVYLTGKYPCLPCLSDCKYPCLPCLSDCKYPCSPDTFYELFCLCDIYLAYPDFLTYTGHCLPDSYPLLIWRVPLLTWQLPCLSDMYLCLPDSYPP